MKKYGIAVLAVAFIFSGAVLAQKPMQGRQDGQGQGQGHKKEWKQEVKEKLTPKKRAGHMAVDMELTDSQRDKLQSLFEKQDKQHEENLAEMKKIKEQQKIKREAMMKANDAEMEKILGTEKFSEMKAKQADRHEKMKQFKNKGNGNREGRNFQGRPEFKHRNAPLPLQEQAEPNPQK